MEIFLTQTFKQLTQLSKNAKLKESCATSLELIKQYGIEVKEEFEESQDTKVNKEKVLNKILSTLTLACELHSPKLTTEALYCIQKILEYGGIPNYFNDLEYPERKLIDKAIDTICQCVEIYDDNVHLEVIKSTLTIIASHDLDISSRSLMNSFIACFNVSIVTKSSKNRSLSRSILNQMISIIFQRYEKKSKEYKNRRMSEQYQVDIFQSFREIVVDIAIKAISTSKDIAEDHKTIIFDASNGIKEEKSVAITILSPNLEIPKSSVTQSYKDCLIIFKTLCQNSMKELPHFFTDESFDTKRKLLALELLHQILKNASQTLKDSNHFNQIIKRDLFISLLVNGVSPSYKIFHITLKIFKSLNRNFKKYLRRELGEFFSKILLCILSNSSSSIHQKLRIIKLFLRLSNDPQTILDIFENFDCSEFDDLFERMVNELASLAKGSLHHCSIHELIQSRLLSLECLRKIMKILATWSSDFAPHFHRSPLPSIMNFNIDQQIINPHFPNHCRDDDDDINNNDKNGNDNVDLSTVKSENEDNDDIVHVENKNSLYEHRIEISDEVSKLIKNPITNNENENENDNENDNADEADHSKNEEIQNRRNEERIIQSIKPMFEVCWCPMLATFSVMFDCNDSTNERQIFEICLDGFEYAVRVSAILQMELERNAFITSLAQYTQLLSFREIKMKNIDVFLRLIQIALIDGNYLNESWEVILSCISKVANYQILAMNSEYKNYNLKLKSEKRRSEKIIVLPYYSSSSSSPSSTNIHHLNSMNNNILSSNSNNAFIEDQNILIISNNINMKEIEKVFYDSRKLNDLAILDFIRNLCIISENEINEKEPRVYCFQQLIEITYYNIEREESIWMMIWKMISSHIIKLGKSENIKISTHSINSLRQLAHKLLQHRNSRFTNRFQNLILSPFVEIFKTPQLHDSMKDLILTSLSFILSSCSKIIQSAWKSIFFILTSSVNYHYHHHQQQQQQQSSNHLILTSAFELLEKIVEDKSSFLYISKYYFKEFILCLTTFANNRIAKEISFRSIQFISSSALHYLTHHHHHQIVNYDNNNGDNDNNNDDNDDNDINNDDGDDGDDGEKKFQYSANCDESFFWKLIIVDSLCGIIHHPNVTIGLSGLESLNKVLQSVKNKFSPDLWMYIYQHSLSSLFFFLEFSNNDNDDDNDNDKLAANNHWLEKESDDNMDRSNGNGDDDDDDDDYYNREKKRFQINKNVSNIGEWMNIVCPKLFDFLISLFQNYLMRLKFILEEFIYFLCNCILQSKIMFLSNISAKTFIHFILMIRNNRHLLRNHDYDDDDDDDDDDDGSNGGDDDDDDDMRKVHKSEKEVKFWKLIADCFYVICYHIIPVELLNIDENEKFHLINYDQYYFDLIERNPMNFDLHLPAQFLPCLPNYNVNLILHNSDINITEKNNYMNIFNKLKLNIERSSDLRPITARIHVSLIIIDGIFNILSESFSSLPLSVLFSFLYSLKFMYYFAMKVNNRPLTWKITNKSGIMQLVMNLECMSMSSMIHILFKCYNDKIGDHKLIAEPILTKYMKYLLSEYYDMHTKISPISPSYIECKTPIIQLILSEIYVLDDCDFDKHMKSWAFSHLSNLAIVNKKEIRIIIRNIFIKTKERKLFNSIK